MRGDHAQPRERRCDEPPMAGGVQPLSYGWFDSPRPETIVFGGRVSVDDQVLDTPRIDPPKPPACGVD